MRTPKPRYKRSSRIRNQYLVVGVGKRSWKAEGADSMVKRIHDNNGPVYDATQSEDYYSRKEVERLDSMKHQRYFRKNDSK